jgi:prepilin-type N-terminal cleavage/methylation domain-containing protein
MRRQSGFSMVELMVAMTVTLIVSAAIYGLLTSGSTAFRREPELADRQQNIRVAMDLIARDVFNAGAALPTFAQVFTRTDPAGGNCSNSGVGLNGCGVEGALGSAAATARAPGDGGDPLTATDVLEIVTTNETCPERTVCSNPPEPLPGNPGLFILRETLPACVAVPGVVMMTDGTSFTLQMTQAGSTPNQGCPNNGAAGVNGEVNLGGVLQPWVASPPLPAPSLQVPPNLPVIFFYASRVVRYRIAPGNDPADPGPALWRSRSGRYGLDGGVKAEPGDSGFPGSSSPWELVARGIEDLQIEYMGGDGLWRSRPPLSAANDWSTLVRQVRITLSARASAPNLQGATTAGGTGPNAVRGQLVTVVAPRAAFNELQMGSQIQ